MVDTTLSPETWHQRGQAGLKKNRTITRKQIARLVADEDDIDVDMAKPSDRPQRRGECCDGPRPCPFVSCKYNLFLDVQQSGSIKLNHPELEPGELQPSCALDVADEGPVTLGVVGKMMGLTRERIRQIQERALRKLSGYELDTFEDTSSRGFEA